MALKKIVALVVAAVFVASTFAAPAPAYGRSSKVKISARVRNVTVSGKTKKVVFKTRMSRPAKVKVAIYKNGKKIRTISKSGRWYRKNITWNLRDSKGRKVAPGSYQYKVTAVRYKATGTRKGSVKVKKPVPAPPSTNPSSTTDPASGSESATSTPDPTPDPGTPGPDTSSGRFVGMWVPGAPSSMDPVAAVEAKIGAKAKVINFFIADSESFPTTRCRNVVDYGATPLITLEFWSAQNGGCAAITNGSKDAYLRAFADQAKAFGNEIWLRPFHEMNGDWYPWGGSTNGNSPTAVIAAWRHVHDVFQSRGATNVKFVWCVNNDSVPYTTANGIAKYWPGDSYVDYLSIDGYNAGTTQSWSSWRSFASVFGASYNTVTALSAKPLFIAETSSVEQGGSKAAWISAMFSSWKTQFPRMVGIVWFNEKKTFDWRIESSTTSIDAFKTAALAGY
jgi:hypothetical protein